MVALVPVITNLGIEKLFNAQANGFQAVISHIAVGDMAYTPSANQNELSHEIARTPIASGNVIDGKTLHLSGIIDGNASYWVREVGFFLDDGTLFAVYSKTSSALAYKNANTNLFLAFDISLASLPANSVTITEAVQDINLHLAGELAQIATANIMQNSRQIGLHRRITSLEMKG